MMQEAKLNRDSSLERYSMLVLSVYVSGCFVFSDLSISAVYGALTLCLWSAAVLFMLVHKFRNTVVFVRWIDFILVPLFLIVAVNLLRGQINRTTVYYLLILGISTFLYAASGIVPRKVIQLSKIVLVTASTLFSLINLMHFFFPTTTNRFLFSLLSQGSVDYCESLFLKGYGVAFGQDVGYTAIITAVGAGILFISTPLKPRKQRALMYLIQLCICFSLFAIQRRGELIVFLVAILITSGILLIKSLRWTKEKKRVICESVLTQLACIILAAALFSLFETSSRFETLGFDVLDEFNRETADETLEMIGNGRLALWRLAWEAFSEKPVFGNGWAFFSTIAYKSGITHVTNVHCVPLQLLCETGVVGLLCVGAYFIFLLLQAFRAIKQAEGWSAFFNYLTALFLVLYMLGNAVVDNSLYHPHWILLLTVAMLLLFKSEETKDKGWSVSLRDEGDKKGI